MKTEWYLESDIFNEGDNHQKLKQEIEAVGDSVVEFNYVPFGGGIQFLPRKDTDVYPSSFIMYGSLQSAKYFQKEGYADVWMNLPRFKCSYYYPRFHKYLFQNPYVFMPYGEILRNWDDLCRMFESPFGGLFIRPDSGYKLFTGTVIKDDRKTYKEEFDKLSFDPNVLPETMCVVAKPKRLTSEYRFVIGRNYHTGENYVVTGCKYRDIDSEETIYDYPIPALSKRFNAANEYVSSFVWDVIKDIDYSPDPFWILDVAEDEFMTLKVLEVGAFSCSGFYGCEIDKIVQHVGDYFKIILKDISE